MNNRETSTNADQSPRLRRPKSREVSSRFLPNSTAPIPSPSRSPISLIRRSPGSSADPRKHRSLEDSAFIRRLCPSPAAPLNRKTGTLFNHLKEERSKDVPSGKNEKKAANSVFLARQNNCRELNSWESRERKENHKPIVGGSMRYTGNIGFSEKFTAPACESSSSGVLRRLSANETAIKRSSSFRRESETFKDYNIDSESECSSLSTSASSLSPMRVANLVRVHGSKTPHWDWAPKRSSLSPESGENRGKLMHNPTSKPQKSTHSRTKGVGSLLSLGLELFRGRKSSSPARTGAIEALHQLRLLHCREIQWRFANAISDVNLT